MSGGAQVRDGSLDAARGWAMLLGLVVHSAVPFTTVTAYAWPVIAPERHGAADWIFHVIHAFRNPLFFLVSGLLARAVTERIGRDAFLERRKRRLFYPLLFCALVISPLAEMAATFARGVAGTLPVNFLSAAFWNARDSYFATQMDPATAEPLWPIVVPWFGPIPFVMHYWRLGIFWFLWYALILAYAGPPLIARIRGALGPRAHAHSAGILDAAMRRWWAPLCVGAIAYPMLALGYGIELSTPIAVWTPFPIALLLPELTLVGFYFVYFAIGWSFHGHPTWLDSARRWCVLWTLIGLAGFAFAITYSNHFDPYRLEDYWRVRLIAQAGYAIGTAGLALGVLGGFMRWHRRQTGVTRFLIAASFWVYLVHIPVITVLQAFLLKLDVPWVVQFVMVMLAAGAICLASYRWLVQGTRLDRFLNGAA